MLHKRHIDPECHYCCWQSGCCGLVFQYNLQYAVSWTLPLKEYLIMPFAFLMQSIFTTVRMKDPCWLCCRTGVIWAIETEGDLNAVLSVGGGCRLVLNTGIACDWRPDHPLSWNAKQSSVCVCVCGEEQRKGFQCHFSCTSTRGKPSLYQLWLVTIPN